MELAMQNNTAPPTQIEEEAWHALTAEDALKNLEAHEHGLTTSQAVARLAQYGENQLQEAPRPTFWHLLWEQLNSFVVILLIIASIISALLGDYVEAAAIVFLEAGNYVPADVRLLESVNLRVEEASLTGESLPVQKNAASILERHIPLGDRKNTAFMGTLVSYGRGRGMVVSTGMRTQLGLIATMLQNVETEETPLQRRLDQLGKTLSIASLILVAIVFVVALINYTEISGLFSRPLNYLQEFAAEITEVFIIAVSLAIAAVPEARTDCT